MKYFEILASFYFRDGLRQQAEGLVVAACALLVAALFLLLMRRSLKKDNDEQLKREHPHENIP